MNFQELRDKYGYEILCKYKLDIPYAEYEEAIFNDEMFSEICIEVQKHQEIALKQIKITVKMKNDMGWVKDLQLLWIGNPGGKCPPNKFYLYRGDTITWTFNIDYYFLDFYARFKKHIFGIGRKLWM